MSSCLVLALTFNILITANSSKVHFKVSSWHFETGLLALWFSLPGDLLGPQPVARTGKEVDYGFFEFHIRENT